MSNMSNRHLEQKVKRQFKYECKMRNARCAHCRQPIDYRLPANHPDSFECDHRYPVATHPDVNPYDKSLYLPSHSRCNRSRQTKPYEGDKWVEANW